MEEIEALDEHIKELEKKMGLDGKKKKKLHQFIDKEGYGDGFCDLLDGIDDIFVQPESHKKKYKPRKASLTDDEDQFVGDSSDQDFSDAEIQEPLVNESELDEDDMEEEGEEEMEEELEE